MDLIVPIYRGRRGASRERGLLHEVLHQAPLPGTVEFDRARLKTLMPSSSSPVQARQGEFEFS